MRAARLSGLTAMWTAALVWTAILSGAAPALAGNLPPPPQTLDLEPYLGGGPDPLAGTATFVETVPGVHSTAEPGLRADNCCDLGGYVNVFSIRNFFQGNVIRIMEEEKILNFCMELNFTTTSPITLYFAIYKRNPANGKYDQVVLQALPVQGAGRALYCSLPINLPVAPEGPGIPAFYALGVAWGATDIQFGRDASTYPQFDCGRRTEGSFGLSITPPPAAELSLGSLFTGGALSMRVCFVPPPGACCLPGNVCQLKADELTCINSNGEFTAGGVACGGFGFCPLDKGACCIPPDSCAYVNIYACTSGLGGTSWDTNDDCNLPHPCAPATGACCLYDGSCINDLNEAECVAQDGTYRGDYSLCSDPGLFCTPTGACCLANSACVTTESESACLINGDVTWHGLGTHCPDPPDFPLDPCDSDLGACCRYDGACALATEYDCEAGVGGATPGTWLGAGVSCTVADCQPQGGCCTSFTSCTDKSDAACSTTWYEGQPCQYSPCSGVVGACCILGECQILNDFDCGAAGGVFEDVGTDAWRACAVTTCAPNTLGACCTGDTCTLTTQGTCAGTFLGVGVPCSDLACVPGYCCGAQGYGPCANLTRGRCLSLGGTPGDPGTTCAVEGQICLQGACCLNDFCGDLDEPACVGFEGDFQGNGTVCSEGACEFGACCERDGTCLETTRVDCEMNWHPYQPYHGVFQGDATTCGVSTCPVRGACCLEGACLADVTQAECASTNGVWQGDLSTCYAGRCTLGACCPCSGSACFDEVVDSQCCGLFTPGGECSTSGLDSCAIACCLDNACTNALPSTCSSLGGTPDSTYRRTCSEAPDLCTDGACCLYGGTFCGLRNILECTALDGVFGGTGSVCVAGACQMGACCYRDGATCDDHSGQKVTRAYCDNIPCTNFVQNATCATASCPTTCAEFGVDQICSHDRDGDGDVDLVDFAAFQQCFEDPAANQPCKCIFDADDSGVIDLLDWLEFDLRFTGPFGTISLLPTGDADGDGDVDLADLGGFQTCFGPGSSGPCSSVFDFDQDNDVDLVDFGQLATHICGPT